MNCSEDECDRPACVELHIPWAENRAVCAAHARVLGRQAGVVADPSSTAELLERTSAEHSESSDGPGDPIADE